MYRYPSEFTPTIAVSVIAEIYFRWEEQGRPLITQQFINDVLSINKTVENHVMWFKEAVQWIADNKV